MSSVPDENSPPRPDPVAKAKMQPSVLDSPSRVTRSQLRRLSSVAAEGQMEPDAVAPLQRTRRSSRRSFVDAAVDDGPSSSQGSKLTSIKENSKLNTTQDVMKPVTRRTRASVKVSNQPGPEIVLPPTRRTRRTSNSSVSSVTSNVVASPRRQTRSRKKLSPVPSPTFSEVSTCSEMPEISPNVGKRGSISGLNTSSHSITPGSSHVSPASNSTGKNSDSAPGSAQRFSAVKETSPVSKKGEFSFTAVRQILVDEKDSTLTKRSSLKSPLIDAIEPVESDLSAESEDIKPPRKSHKKLSLSSRKSPLKFTESPMEEIGKNPEKSIVVTPLIDKEPVSNVFSIEDVLLRYRRRSCDISSLKSSPGPKLGVSPELSRSLRNSNGRSSLSLSQSSPGKVSTSEDLVNLSDDVDSTVSSSPVVLLSKLEEIEKLDSSRQSSSSVADHSPRESTGRSSWKSSPLQLTEVPVNTSPKKSQFEVADSVTDGNKASVLVLGRVSLSSDKSTPEKCSLSEDSPQVSHSEPQRNSMGRVSLSSNKSIPAKCSVSEDSPQVLHSEPQRNSMRRVSLSSNKSTPAKCSVGEDSPRVSLSESQRNSMGRVSLSSNKSTPAKCSVSEDSPQVSHIEPQRNSMGKLSLSSNKSTPAKCSVSEDSPRVSLSEPQRNSMERVSLSSNKSTPVKPSISEDSPHVLFSEPQRNSKKKLSLSSNKSTSPAKPSANDSSTQLSHNEPRRNSMGKFSLSSKPSPVGHRLTFDNEDSESIASSTHCTETKDMPGQNLDSSNQSSSSPTVSEGNVSLLKDNANDDMSKKAKIFSSFLNADTLSRSASTGNLPKTSGLKSKSRSSMGPLINPLVSYMASEDKEATSDSSVDNADNSVTICDEHDLDTDVMKISPIKKNDLALKRDSITPSSSDKSFSESEQQHSCNNPFEKSTVFDEMDESFGTSSETIGDAPENIKTSHKSPNLNMSEKSIKNIFSDRDIPSEAAELSKNSPSLSKLSFNFNSMGVKSELSGESMKVYKDAAVLLSGGNLSYLDGDDSDDDQWESVSSSATKTKKEIRMEKKAKNKAEKQARKMAKLEQAVKSDSSLEKERKLDLNDSESIDVGTNSGFQSEVSIPASLSTKRKSAEGNQEFSMVASGLEMDNEINFKKRKSLPQSDTITPLKKSDAALLPKTDLVVLTSKKSKKRNSRDAELETCVNIDFKTLKPEKVPELKKQESLIQSTEDKTHAIVQEESREEFVSRGGKVKKQKKNEKTGTASHQTLTQENEAQISTAGSKLLKKKKKQKLIDGAGVSNGFVADEHSGESSMKLVKKKKNKKQTSSQGDSVPKDQSSIMIKKKKNLKNSSENELSTIIGVSDYQLLTATKTKKKLKKTLQSEPIADSAWGTLDEPAEAHKKKKLKKKEIVFPSVVLEEYEKNTVAEGASNEVLIKKKKAKKQQVNETDIVTIKKKKNVWVESDNIPEVINISDLEKKKKKSLVEIDKNAALDGHSTDLISKKKLKKKGKKTIGSSVPTETGNASDSDDAPTSVSFSAGKSAALAELEAAAESIKRLKEFKRKKMQLKLDKIKEEKAAKVQRLKNKQKHDDNLEFNSVKGVNNGSSSSKISFDAGSWKTGMKRLPTDLLESLSEQPPTKLVKQSDSSKKIVLVAAASAEEQEHLDKKRAAKIARKLEKQRFLESDYVPLDGVLGATRFGVVPLRNIMLAKKLEKNRLAEEAANFRQQSLFGNRIRRTPISVVLAHQDKLKASGKDRTVVHPK